MKRLITVSSMIAVFSITGAALANGHCTLPAGAMKGVGPNAIPAALALAQMGQQQGVATHENREIIEMVKQTRIVTAFEPEEVTRIGEYEVPGSQLRTVEIEDGTGKRFYVLSQQIECDQSGNAE